MRLYAMKGGRWAGTQADAKTIDTEFAQVEVPTDKPGLLKFLNRNCVEPIEIWPHEQDAPDLPPAFNSQPGILDVAADVPIPALTSATVVEWILETATPAQVESVFAALGARFHEARKGETA